MSCFVPFPLFFCVQLCPISQSPSEYVSSCPPLSWSVCLLCNESQSGSVLYLCVLRVPASYSNTSFVYLVFIFLQFIVFGLCPACSFCLVTFCHQLCAWTLYFRWTWFTALLNKAHLLFVYLPSCLCLQFVSLFV